MRSRIESVSPLGDAQHDEEAVPAAKTFLQGVSRKTQRTTSA